MYDMDIKRNLDEYNIRKESIMKLIENEQVIERNRKSELLRKVIEETKPKIGKTKREDIYLPMPTHEKVLENKNINIKSYGAIMLQSNWGGKFLNAEDRFIYNEKLNQITNEVAEELKISTRVLKTHISKLRKCNIKILEPCKTVSGDLFYRLNYSTDLKYYTLINEKALKKLINAYSENTLRIYLVLLYKCFVNINSNGELIYKEMELKQSYICEKIGLKPSSRKKVTDCVDALVGGGFIKVRLEYKTEYENKNGNVLAYPIVKYFYSISNEYLKSKIKKR